MFFSPCLSGLTDQSSGERTQQELLRSGALAMPGLSLWRMADENPLRMEEKGGRSLKQFPTVNNYWWVQNRFLKLVHLKNVGFEYL